jgi:hypothetical protein
MKSNIRLFNAAIAAMEEYLISNNWIKNKHSGMWSKSNTNQFYIHEAFEVQADIDFYIDIYE